MNGLQRLLSVYNLSTVAYNENYSNLLTAFYNYTTASPPRRVNNGFLTSDYLKKRNIHLRIMFMPDREAKKYPNELGFCADVMKALMMRGEEYGRNPTDTFDGDVNGLTMAAVLPSWQ